MWQGANDFAVHLSLHVVRELANEAAASAEIRGILLGRSIQAPFVATIAEDFVVIPPSHDFEKARYEAEHDGRDLHVIGYFRSQRDGRLRLGTRDVQTFDRLFCEDGNIGLLIRAPRRGDSESALFYWQYGQPQPREFGFGFPMDAEMLAGGHPGWRFPDPVERELASTPRSAFHRSPESHAVTRGEGIRWSRLLPTAVLAIAGIVVTQWPGMPVRRLQPMTPAQLSRQWPRCTLAQASYESALGLKVTSQPHQLEIRWNRAAPLVSAAKGTMSISEAGVTESIPFDTATASGWICGLHAENE